MDFWSGTLGAGVLAIVTVIIRELIRHFFSKEETIVEHHDGPLEPHVPENTDNPLEHLGLGDDEKHDKGIGSNDVSV